MSVDSACREVESIRKKLGSLHHDRAQETKNAAGSLEKATTAEAAAKRTSSVSVQQSKLREARGHRETHAKQQKKLADIENKISSETKRLAEAEKKLSAEQAREQKQHREQQERVRKQNRQQQERVQQRQAEEMRSMSETLESHALLHELTQARLARLRELPEKIRVLLLAANPLDSPRLQLDEEVRAIQEKIRMSEHRDAVELVSRWAIRPGDLMQAIHEIKPLIVHFSGHGAASGAIVLQGQSGQSKLVPQAAIVEMLAVTAGRIQLVFFNNCYSCEWAKAVAQHVPAAIGMNAVFSDEASRLFAASFYSAIGFGRSIAQAFREARVALMLEGVPEEGVPELFSRADGDVEELVLVRPESVTSVD
ncbi:MAG: CHAT domain-containing protein [Myxococcales bacterium]|nr:CHAT domain-containing protein [Myxococcales bacterium]